MLIDLPSSSSAVDFPNNINSNYKVKLSKKLVLNPGEWEIGALAVHVPNKFYNVTIGEVMFEVIEDESNVSVKHRLTTGFYKTTEALVREITSEARKWKVGTRTCASCFTLSYNRTQNTVIVTVAQGVTVSFSPDLIQIFGLEEVNYTKGEHRASRPCNMFYGLSYLMIYSNLVQGRLVGDTQAPLLRVIPVFGNYGDAAHEFRHIHYVEAAGFNSDVVEVNIRTDTGELAPFVDGKVLITLQLRRKNVDRQ